MFSRWKDVIAARVPHINRTQFFSIISCQKLSVAGLRDRLPRILSPYIRHKRSSRPRMVDLGPVVSRDSEILFQGIAIALEQE